MKIKQLPEQVMSEDRVYTNFGPFQDHPNPPKGVYLEKLIEKDQKTNKNGPKPYILIIKMSGRTLSSLKQPKIRTVVP